MQAKDKQMQETRRAAAAASADFDFGAVRRAAGKSAPEGKRPGLVAGLIAFAFGIAMLTPVAGKAEAIWERPHGFNGGLSTIMKPGYHDRAHEKGHGNGHSKGHGKGHHGRDDHRGPSGGKKAVTLPGVCAISIDARGGKTWYVADCLRDRGIKSKSLPRSCAAEARIGGRKKTVYAGDCLRRAGFRTGRG